jgi:hypothetical protein
MAYNEARVSRSQRIGSDELKVALPTLTEGTEHWKDAEYAELFAFLDVDQDGLISKVVTCVCCRCRVLREVLDIFCCSSCPG